jgi:hypothetical protein
MERAFIGRLNTRTRNEDISIDILDLRTLLPLDYTAIEESVERTGKVLILHEDTLTGGIGGEIAAWISEHCFEMLDAPVLRCASLDTPVPFNIELEKNFLAKARLEKCRKADELLMPTLYIIAGPNGAGKTTASKTLLPEVFHTNIFINADEIALQLNPSNVEAAAIRAGRMMLLEIEKRLSEQTTFSIETTLATRSYLNLVRKRNLPAMKSYFFSFIFLL